MTKEVIVKKKGTPLAINIIALGLLNICLGVAAIAAIFAGIFTPGSANEMVEWIFVWGLWGWFVPVTVLILISGARK